MEPLNPAEAAVPPLALETQAHSGHHLSSARRIVATTLLSVGMMAIGGVAIVNAASPAPAASGAPSTGTPTHPGGGSTTNPANCPNMGNGTTAPAG